MRNIAPALRAHLSGGVTTMCLIWTLIRRDGQVFGFTDHDAPLLIGGIDYSAASGLSAGRLDSRLGFAVDNSTAAGILTDARITADDIRAGLYDGARLTMAAVNWQDTSQQADIAAGFIGQITQSGDAFDIEWLGEGARLDRSQGRVFSRQCDAEFGDARCGLNAANFPAGTTCPRTFFACHRHFGNSENFRGFPYMLGDDALTAAPQSHEARDGGSRFEGLLD